MAAVNAISAIEGYWMISAGSEKRGKMLKGRGGAERKKINPFVTNNSGVPK